MKSRSEQDLTICLTLCYAESVGDNYDFRKAILICYNKFGAGRSYPQR
jgi:hypothetical protein